MDKNISIAWTFVFLYDKYTWLFMKFIKNVEETGTIGMILYDSFCGFYYKKYFIKNLCRQNNIPKYTKMADICFLNALIQLEFSLFMH